MKERKVDTIRKCDLCGAVGDCYYDAPTLTGQWANMCPDCWVKQESPSIGTCFVLRTKKHIPAEGILLGTEATTLDDLLNDDRDIECPNCGETHGVEPDAAYVYTCEGCGTKVRVPCLM